ncbi:MAG: type II toxin-antitoxin system ParD family antitoxin [bacterium]
MTSMNISVPEPMRDWVEAQVRAGNYGNVSEYVRELIRQDQKRKTQERLEELLLEGMNSPKSAMTKKDWAEIRSEVVRRVAEARGGGARRAGKKS